jgi:hypothetical protein
MIKEADLWDRFSSPAYWWMHAMAGLWAIFAIGLFVVEPLILDRRLHALTLRQPAATFAWLAGVHWLLLTGFRKADLMDVTSTASVGE